MPFYAHAAATAGRKAMIAAKKAAEIAAKLAKSAAEEAKALYAAIIAGGAASTQQAEIPRCFGMMTIFSQTLPALQQQPIYSELPWYQRLPKREQGRLSPWASAR